MAQSGFWQILVLVYLSNVFHLDVAQIMFGDEATQTILFARLPVPVNENTIFDQREYINIPLGRAGVSIRSLDYDPVDEKVYWCSPTSNKIQRIRSSEASPPHSPEPYISTTSSPHSLAIDRHWRKFYYTVNDSNIIYFKANLISTEPTRELLTLSTLVKHITITVDSSSTYSYLFFTSPDSQKLVRYDVLNRLQLQMKEIYAQALVVERCLTVDNAPLSSRLYYYYDSGKLGYSNTLKSEDRTIGILPDQDEVRTDMAKYGSKLFFIRNSFNDLVEYDTMSNSIMYRGEITVSLKRGGIHSFTPTSIRIIHNYTEPVEIVDCPMNTSVHINISSTDGTQQVYWTEPTLNSWSNCASLEFLGPGTNGGNFSQGVYSMLYSASDKNGNTDTCNFTVTVPEVMDTHTDASTTDASSSSPQSEPSRDGTTQCSDDNPPSGRGMKTSCTFITWVFSIALFITVFK